MLRSYRSASKPGAAGFGDVRGTSEPVAADLDPIRHDPAVGAELAHRVSALGG